MTTHQFRSEELKDKLAARTARLFNDRYRIGGRVLHIAAPGTDPVATRTSSEAFELAGRSLVYVRHTLDPVETDSLYAIPPALTPPVQRTARRSLTRDLLVFASGFVTAVAIGLLMPPAKAVAPEHIVIDCYEPGEAPGEVETETDSGRAQA